MYTSFPGVIFLNSSGQTNYPLTLSLDDDDNSLCVSVQVVSPVSYDVKKAEIFTVST